MVKKLFCSAITIACVALSSNLSTKSNAIRKVSALSNATLSSCQIVEISSGSNHVLALDNLGNLFAWGKNDYGQLGNGNKENSNVPLQIMPGTKFKMISAGNDCSAAIDENGILYGWGKSINPAKKETTIPTAVSLTDKYKSVFCSLDYSTGIKEGEAKSYYFGYGLYTWYSSGSTSKYTSDSTLPYVDNSTNSYRFSSPESVNTSSSNTICADGLYVSSYFYSTPSYMSGGTTTQYVYDFFLVDSNGKLTYSHKSNCTSGSSRYGKVFFKDLDFSNFENKEIVDVSVEKISDVNASTNASAFFVDSNGLAYVIGKNSGSNIFGINESIDVSSSPVQIAGLSNIRKVSAGKNFATALTNDGKLYAWGDNTYGQLGNGNFNTVRTPSVVSYFTDYKSFSVIANAGETNVGSFSLYGGTGYEIITPASKGDLVIDHETGDFTYTPYQSSRGSDAALINIDYDGIGLNYPVNFYINNKPRFTGGDNAFNLDMGSSFTGNAPCFDYDNDPLIYSIYKNPDKGSVILNNNSGSYTYYSDTEEAGADYFVIAVSDGYSLVQYPVSVHIQSYISCSDETTIKIDVENTRTYNGNVNAIDIDGDTLAYSIKKNGTKGNVSIDEFGNYSYVAKDGSYGLDTFIVEIDDGYMPVEVTYSVHLYSVHDDGTVLAAKITKGYLYSGEIKTAANGAIPEYSIQSQPLNGNVTINSETGEYTYTPNLGSSGDDSFVVLVDYGFGQYTITIHIYQNTIPDDALVSRDITTSENTNYSGTAQCTDIDSDSLTYSVKTQPKKGSLSLNPTTGEYIYYPNQNVAGDDSFEVNVCDGTDIITIFINVHIESEIVADLEINKTISQNTSLSAKVTASDKDGDALVYSITKNADHGIANIDSLTGDYIYIPNTNYFGLDTFEITVDDGVSPKVVTVNVNVNRRPIANNITINLETEGITVTGTAACSDPDGDTLTYSLVAQPSQGNVIVNSSNGGFAYTPNADAHGNDSFQIKATDGCDDIFVTVKVHNETPVELENQESTIVVNQGKSTTGNVLAVDLDGDELTYSILSYPTQGIVNLNSSTGAWTYNAKTTAKGRDSFKVQVTDGKSTVILEYTLIINTPASFEEDSYSFNTNQNNNYTGSVVATDADGDSLTYSIVSQGNKGTATVDPLTGRYQYAPDEGKAGNDAFIIGVSDGNFTSEVTVNVHIESDITIASGTLTVNVEKNDIVTGNVNASDADGDTLTYSISKQGEKGNANVMGDGSFSYYANSGAGDDSFIVAITDGIHTSYVTIYVHISTEPYFEESSVSISVPQSGSTEGQVHGVDPDGDTLSYSVYEQPSHGTVNLNSTNGKYTYTAFSNSAASSDSFRIAVSYGTTTSYVTVNVVINNAPAINDSSLTISQGGSGSGTVVATDPEDDTLTYSISAQGGHGSASINSSTGEYTYTTTDPSFSGTDYFTISVTDGYSIKSIVVTVNVVKNQKPTSTGTTINVNSGSSVEGQLSVTDPENDSLTYSISSQGDKGTAFIDENTGKFVYSAKPDTTGYDCFVVTVSDGHNTVSYLVEVNITFVDSNNSWAIPTTIATSSLAALSLGGLAFVLAKGKKKKVK
ncbi:MAG: tandem-95 repeat protein [Erysipelotrichaceae bacterium]|nr:tandem-95 repeat protein [Erysipelotrichaceae bacterium]